MAGGEFPILPFEVIVTILLILPLDSLIRLSSVCKAFRAFIRNGEFISRHLQLRASKGNDYMLCCPTEFNSKNSFKFFSHESHQNVFGIEVPSGFDPNGFALVCASNGLVCLTPHWNFNLTIYLCNPFIRKSKIISSSSIDLSSKCYDFLILGFGYHAKADDYKILRIAYKVRRVLDIAKRLSFTNTFNYENIDETEVELYSLSTDTWKQIEFESFPWYVYDVLSRVFVNDCIHWMANSKPEPDVQVMILSFNLDKEAFQEISLPDSQEFIYHDNQVATYKDHLACATFYPDRLDIRICSMWVMKEYGVVGSWMKLFTIADQPIHYPVTLTRHDEILLDGDMDDVIFYNFVTHETKRIHLDAKSQDFDFLELTGSLVLPMSKEELVEEDSIEVVPSSEQISMLLLGEFNTNVVTKKKKIL